LLAGSFEHMTTNAIGEAASNQKACTFLVYSLFVSFVFVAINPTMKQSMGVSHKWPCHLHFFLKKNLKAKKEEFL
jgi:hypothetical protein